MTEIESYCANDVYDPPFYSQGMKVTGADAVLFLSGQVAYDRNGGVLYPNDFKAQARDAFRAIKSLVEAQGGDLTNVVKLTTYVTNIRYRNDLAQVREEFFPGKAPASTLLEISGLAHPDWLIEIEAIAVL